ncbi:MYXO-CTERM sorting domain-containing protein [Janthinobacterium sp. SUN118]
MDQSCGYGVSSTTGTAAAGALGFAGGGRRRPNISP